VTTEKGATPAAVDAPGGGRAKGERNLVFAIVSFALFMNSIDQTIVATAVPSIQHDLHARIGWTAWTITIYSLGQVLAKPMIGRLSDQVGPRRIFIGSVVVFTGASLCCGLAPNIYLLVVMRFIQALGGGSVIPAGSALISDAFGRDRDRALGLFTSVVPAGAIVGPILGGVLVSAWSWRGIFLVNLPIGVVVILVAAARLPELVPTRRPGRSDFGGVGLLALMIVAAMVGVTELGDASSSNSPRVIAVVGLAIAVAVAIVLWRHLQRHENPVIEPKLLRGSAFGTMNLINFLYGASALGLSALVPLYAQRRYSIPSLEAGTMLTARAVGMILVSGLATFALRRTGYRAPMFIGSVVLACGLILMSVPAPWSPVVWLAMTAAFTGLGMGVVAPASNNATINLAPQDLPAIVGLRGTFRQAGSIAAVSIATAYSERSGDAGVALGHVFLVFAIIVIASLPLILKVPDHRGAW
jgi:EmrB/QacA subfamily drug resistance transporter